MDGCFFQPFVVASMVLLKSNDSPKRDADPNLQGVQVRNDIGLGLETLEFWTRISYNILSTFKNAYNHE